VCCQRDCVCCERVRGVGAVDRLVHGGAVTGAAVWNHCGVPRRRQALTLPSSIVIVAIPSLESQKLVSSVVPSRLG
jgi:hypothetical protein